MATPAEKSFVQHLTVQSSLDEIVRFGLPIDVFPDDAIQRIYGWVLGYYHEDSRRSAPSVEAMRVHFANELAEHEIEVEYDPADTLEWTFNVIVGAHIDRQWQDWVRRFAPDMAEADVADKNDRLGEALAELMELHTSMTRKTQQVDFRDGLSQRLDEYDLRSLTRSEGRYFGVRLGLPLVDEHMHGVWPGELCVIGGGPKMGKSYLMAFAALKHWLSGGTPTLYTLENSVEMTEDRIACLAAKVDARRWLRGECLPEEIERVRAVLEEMRGRSHPFWVIQPNPGQRTAEDLVRRASVLGDSVYIDQLTFLDPPKRSDRRPRHEQLRDILHDLKSLITGSQRMPCLLAHQISREGVKAAERSGRVEMYHFAEVSEVERTADWAFALWQGPALRSSGRAYFQLLAARREDLQDWEMHWTPWTGQIIARAPIDLRSQ